jgi:DNA-binding transcriptional ArsR family regulator
MRDERMLDLDVISSPASAATVLDPIKSRILAELSRPASAAAIAGRVGLSRQKVNYHLRGLEAHGLVEPAEERRWGGLTERLMVATASSYVVSPAALGALGADPARGGDRLSASYLIALAARTVREVGELWARARRTDKRTVIRFRSPEDRAAFTADLGRTVAALAAHYHDGAAGAGRPHRFVVAAYPAPEDAQP